MTKEIMEIMSKAEQKYLATVKAHGMNNRLQELYSNRLEETWRGIITDASRCVRLGLVSQSQVDTLKSQLQARKTATYKKGREIYVQEFCGGSEHEAGIQYWMYHNNLTREQAEEFVEWLEEYE